MLTALDSYSAILTKATEPFFVALTILAQPGQRVFSVNLMLHSVSCLIACGVDLEETEGTGYIKTDVKMGLMLLEAKEGWLEVEKGQEKISPCSS